MDAFFKTQTFMKKKDYIGRFIIIDGETFKISEMLKYGLARVDCIVTGISYERDILYCDNPNKLKHGVKLVPETPKNDFFPLY